MTGEMLFVLAVVALAGLLMVSGKVRLDIVALLVVLAFVLGGTLTVPDALAGFGDPVVVMVAGLLVISEMLARTGVAHQVGKWIARHGREGEARLLVLLTLVVAFLGCFMSNTAVVAVFIPVVLSIANKNNLNPSRLLMPLAYAGIVSGMLTLIATTPNLVVSEVLSRAGFEPFGFFSFTPVGVTVLCVFLAYMIVAGRHLLPGERFAPRKTASRGMQDLLAEFELLGTAHRLQVPIGSALIGQTLSDSKIGSRYNVWIFILERSGRLISDITTAPSPDTQIRGGDVLVVQGGLDAAEQVARDHSLNMLAVGDRERERWVQETGMAKLLIHPDSKLIGVTLREIGLHRTYGVQVLAIRRKDKSMEAFLDQRLESGDAMLVVGPWKRIQQLQSKLHDFVVLVLPAEIEWVAPAWQRSRAALAILALMVVLAAFKIVPIVITVTLCALLAVVTRCLTMEQAYSAIHWSTVVLIAGMLSVAQAMVKSGAAELLAGYLVAGVGQTGPYVMLGALFALAAALSMVLTNTASAILCAPIALRAAESLDVAPHAFAMAVAIASSAGFVVPVSSAAVMLVVGPGKYRLVDFFKVGIPLLILTAIVTIILTPLLFPFKP